MRVIPDMGMFSPKEFYNYLTFMEGVYSVSDL